MPFRHFSDYKHGTGLPRYEVHILLSGSVRNCGLLVCGPNPKEQINNIGCALWSLLLKLFCNVYELDIKC